MICLHKRRLFFFPLLWSHMQISKHVEKYDSQSPNVNRFMIVLFKKNDFWRAVRTSCDVLGQLPLPLLHVVNKLFGRMVIGQTNFNLVCREVVVSAQRFSQNCLWVHNVADLSSQAKIADNCAESVLYLFTLTDQDIRWLNISMDNSCTVHIM